MSTPTANELFRDAWCKHVHSEHGTQPGTPEWAEQRRALKRQWAAVWLDCADLAQHLADCSAFTTALNTGEVSPCGDAPELDNGDTEG